MKYLSILTLALSSTAFAAEIITTPTAPGYSIVMLDAKKLKTIAATALQQWPGEECTTPTDVNGTINCPNLSLSGVYSSQISATPDFWSPSVTTIDSKGRVKTSGAKVDGVRQKYWINGRSVTATFVNPASGATIRPLITCPNGTLMEQPNPQPVPISVTPLKKITEFGIEFYNDAESYTLSDIDVEVNGTVIDTYTPTIGIQYVGVSESDGINSVRFIPHDYNVGQPYGCGEPWLYGYIRGNRFFYK
ncbi:MAG: hypothetical protein HOP23_08380 [Methylococcaceae bacterium]|nr:hypothetical protein [Methylococcaceae bacterium]